MNRDKQIEEMAKDLCHTGTCEIKKIGITCNHQCKAHIYATRAIDKGYHKASEVAREIFEEIEKSIANLEYNANTLRKTVTVEELKAQCNWILHEVIPKTLAELKKKYTEGDNGT